MQDSIVILLSIYNGEKYLKEQFDSLYAQTYKNFKIIAIDDGSQDKSIEILKKYEVELIKSDKNVGAGKSFSILLEFALQKSDANYFMFCDQDDVWYKDKIEKTLQKMKELELSYKDKPLLVHTDLTVVDENLKLLHNSYWKYQNIDVTKDNFQRLLVENVITGCTIMINKNLATLSSPIPKDIIMHDWWLGLVASYFGKIAYIDEPTMKYRQHGFNDTGAKRFDIKFILSQMKKKHNLSRYTTQANSFLGRFDDKIDNETKKMLEDFVGMKKLSAWGRRRVFLKYGIFKNGFIRNVGLLFRSSL